MWIIAERFIDVRGKKYDMLVNLDSGNKIFIDIYKDQPADNLNLQVWLSSGKIETRLFTGTEVECIRMIDKYMKKLNAEKVNAWE